ncbi:hypothetical protein DFQ30_005988 [Apophysomyces sp. BC1015]|nr:hypothetical protein DFQ30_005988 [Apophysomyces sp. BC1015]
MTLEYRCRDAIGPAAILVPVVMIFYFPVRTIGVQTEAVLYGTFGALISAAWCILGLYLADLARDHSNPNPFQAGACAIMAVFLFLGTFVLNYIRMKFSKANFACVNSCIVLTFSMTQGAVFNGFYPEVVWTFLRPTALAGGIALVFNVFIWPDDSITNYMGMLKKTLLDYNTFFKEYSDAFLSSAAPPSTLTLPSLYARLQGNILLLIDCKRAVQREITYTRLSSKDVSQLTRLAKEMSVPLHGVGHSFITKNDCIHNPAQSYLGSVDLDGLSISIEQSQTVCQALSEACVTAVMECIQRLGNFHASPRTNLNSILWPFPRLFKKTPTANDLKQYSTLQNLESAIQQFDNHIRNDESLQLLHLHYQFNLREYATHVKSLVELIGQLEISRPNRRLWFPAMSLKKWFRSGDFDRNVGGDQGNCDPIEGDALVRTATNNDVATGDSEWSTTPSGKYIHRDPDVSAPSTKIEWFFYGLHRIRVWFVQQDTFFAFKTAVGVVLFAIPAWRIESAGWYMDWRGQWAMVNVVLWMYPMTGTFVFAVLLRVIGTIIGAVLGMIVWEITRGNPYGLAVLSFFLFIPHYHVFFFTQNYKVVALMSKVTLILVFIYEYNYVLEQGPNAETIYLIAGKRFLSVVIGVTASVILCMIPYPETGRVELRIRLAKTIREIGQLYGILAAYIASPSGKAPVSDYRIKAFTKRTSELRRQTADERTLLHLAAFEPPLRGKFPAETYKTIMEAVDNMATLVYCMGYTAIRMDPARRRLLGTAVPLEGKDYLACVMTTFKVISATMAAKTQLPPYMIAPREARERYERALKNTSGSLNQATTFNNDTSYSAHVVNSLAFVSELQRLLDVATDLLGSEKPEEWLLIRVPEDRPVLVDALSGKFITLAGLKRDVGRFAAGLQDVLQFQKGDVLALYAPNLVDYSVPLFGTVAAGGTTSTANPTYTPQELAHQLEDVNAKILIAHPLNLDSALKAAEMVGLPKNRVFIFGEKAVNGIQPYTRVFMGHRQAIPVELTKEEAKETVAYLCFSSGTTGRSKGVMTTHANITSNLLQLMPIEDSAINSNVDRMIGLLPFFHMYGLFLMLHAALYWGIPVFVMPRFDLVQFCETVHKYKITYAPLVPPILVLLAKDPLVAKYDLSSIATIVSGAAPLGADLAKQVIARFPHLRIKQAYGMSEVSPAATLEPNDCIIAGSVGPLFPSMVAKIVNEDGQEVGPNQRGELWLKGPNVMKGYINNAEATAACIDAEGYFHTGDVVYVDDNGHFFVVDRVKELIKYKGFQVPPAELESILLESPLVADCAVIGIHDEEQQTELPCAYVVLNPGVSRSNETREKIKKVVADQVAHYKHLRIVRFVDVIPKSPSGKILRRILRDQANEEKARSEKAKL